MTNATLIGSRRLPQSNLSAITKFLHRICDPRLDPPRLSLNPHTQSPAHPISRPPIHTPVAIKITAILTSSAPRSSRPVARAPSQAAAVVTGASTTKASRSTLPSRTAAIPAVAPVSAPIAIFVPIADRGDRASRIKIGSRSVPSSSPTNPDTAPKIAPIAASRLSARQPITFTEAADSALAPCGAAASLAFAARARDRACNCLCSIDPPATTSAAAIAPLIQRGSTRGAKLAVKNAAAAEGAPRDSNSRASIRPSRPWCSAPISAPTLDTARLDPAPTTGPSHATSSASRRCPSTSPTDVPTYVTTNDTIAASTNRVSSLSTGTAPREGSIASSAPLHLRLTLF